ncbi:MAG: DNA-binding transcriptional regulator [Roseibacillus sp.]|nr:DNA-binding transcriptional regulator [Roseibacillus sp.]
MPLGEEKHVGLLVEPLHGLDGRIMDGVARWVRGNPGWTVAVFEGNPGELARLARRWKGDGMLCTLTSEQMQEAANSRNIPVVNVDGQALNHNTVSVVSDHPACARMALEHFQDRGFAHFCFIGNESDSDDLGTAFLSLCQEQSIIPTSFEATLGEEKQLANWLTAQVRPLAILTSSDRQASSVLEACHLAGIAVPEEIAVLGAGNNTQLCELCTPALSSIDCDLEARGYEAASLLFQLMRGDARINGPIRIPPTSISTRRSTDIYAFEDVDLSNALRFIHDHAHESIKVKDVLGATSISRRSLENRIRRHFSRSLHEEIWRVHFELAQKLLTTTDLGLQEVAERSGFRTASALANLFKQKTGLTPRSYRAEHRR